jgi:hypothetical protein
MVLGASIRTTTPTPLSRSIRPVGNSTRGPSRPARWAMVSWSAGSGALARAHLGGGGLPACVWPAGTRPAGRRGTSRAGAATADGRRPPGRADTGQVRPDRRPGGRPRRPARTTLPVAQHDQAFWEVKLLVDHLEQLVAERTRTSTGCAGTCTSRTRPGTRHRRLPGPGWVASPPGSPRPPPTPAAWCRSGSARPKSAPSRPAPTRSASWTGNSANASPSSPHRCSACLAAGH